MKVYPVKNPIITSPYGDRFLNGRPQFHDGIDMVSSNQIIKSRLEVENTGVYAITDGIVTYDYDKYDDRYRFDLKGHKSDSAGNMVILKHNIDGVDYYCRYLHLINNIVKKGQHVKCGELIGEYADVGYSYGAHLHFDVYLSDWSKKIDPMTILE